MPLVDDRLVESLMCMLFWKESAKSNHGVNSLVMSYVCLRDLIMVRERILYCRPYIPGNLS